MDIETLIEKLKLIQGRYGNIPVKVAMYDCGTWHNEDIEIVGVDREEGYVLLETFS